MNGLHKVVFTSDGKIESIEFEPSATVLERLRWLHFVSKFNQNTREAVEAAIVFWSSLPLQSKAVS